MKGQYQRFGEIAGMASLALIAVGCAVVLRPFLSALLWAAILCYATWPVCRRLERFLRGRKSAAAVLMTALIATVIFLPFAVVSLSFADDVARLAQRVRDYDGQELPELPDRIARLPLLGERLQTHWDGLRTNTNLAADTLKAWFDRSMPLLLRWSLSLGQGVLQLALSILIAFFFYRDGDVLTARVSAVAQRIAGDYSRRLLHTVGATVQSVVYGLLGTALAQGIVAGFGFAIAGIPAALLWALLTFLLALLPAGAPLVWVPITAWLFLQGSPGWGVFMGLWGLFAISGIDNLIRPMIISRGGTLPFVLTLLGVMGGLFAFGFIGMFLGPILLAVGYSLVHEFLGTQRDDGAPKEPNPPVPGIAG